MNTKSGKNNFIAVILLAAVIFCFLLGSPMNPIIQSPTGTDSSVFRTVAYMMEHGFMPYRDSFDHKGPLLYILNWCGNRISSKWGIWLIEFVFLMTAFVMIYKISSLISSRRSSYIVTLVCMLLFEHYFEMGNFTEEYAMAFIAAALFIFMDYLRNNVISNNRLFVCGFCFGGTLLLRPNMISTWAVMCIVVLIKAITDKQWKSIGRFLLWFLAGMASIMLPILIWLGVNDDLSYCWESYIVFNMRYVSEEGGRATLNAKCMSMYHFLSSGIYIALIVSLIYLSRLQDRFLNIVYAAYVAVSVVLICISGMNYNHYGIILVPVAAYPLALFLNEFDKNGNRKLANLFIIFVVSILMIPSCRLYASYVLRPFRGAEETKIVNTVAEIIDENTSEDDCISVYGNWDVIYIISDRRHATRYSYQLPIGKVMPSIMDEYMEQLQEELPPIIVIEHKCFDHHISSFLDKNDYQLIWSQNNELLDSGARIYKR